MNERTKTKQMLETLRQHRGKSRIEPPTPINEEDGRNDNFLTNARTLMSEAVETQKKNLNENKEGSDGVVINKSTPQFGDIRVAQEEMVRKTINNSVKFEEDALRYYPDSDGMDDLRLEGKIPSLNIAFKFRYNDPSGGKDGCYLWANSVQLTEDNTRTIGKLRDAFTIWRDSIVSDADLMEKLRKATSRN